MRKLLAFGAAIAVVGVAGCNNGGGKSNRATAAAAVTSASTGGVNSNPGGSGGSTGGGSSTAADAPQVTSLSPSFGPVDGGTAVIISGSNFAKSGAGETLVLFGTRAVVVSPTSDTSLQVAAPMQLQPGTVDVRVINDLGVATLVGAFRYDLSATGLTFAPTVGSTDLSSMAGTEVTIDVKGFNPLTSAVTVAFGSNAATVVTVVDADTVKAEVPFGISAGPTTITVTDGSTTATSTGFTVQGALAYGDLIVNEVFFHPDSADPNNDRVLGGGNNQSDEFVEIVNTTTETIDITWLVLTGESNTTLHQFANPTTLPPGGAIVVFSGGNPNGFAPRHVSGQAQTSTNSGLGLRNSGADEVLKIEDPNHPDPATFAPQVLFHAELISPGIATSYVNKNDGQRITANPATAADYEAHPDLSNAQGLTVKFSPGKKKDGSDF